MHVKGTDKQADHCISTPEIVQAVRGNSDLPVRAWEGCLNTPPSTPVRTIDAPARPQPVPTSAKYPARIRSRENAPVPSSTTGRIYLRRKCQNHHRREADVEVSTAHPVASGTETIRRIGGPSKCGRSAAHRLKRNPLDLKTSRPTGTATIDFASQKHQIIRNHHRREADVEGSTAH